MLERNPDVPADLGYGIRPEYRERVYSLEASRAVLDYWQHEFGLKNIMAWTTEGDVVSKKILLKLGFEEGGYASLDGSKVACYVLPGMTHHTYEQTKLRRFGNWFSSGIWMEIIMANAKSTEGTVQYTEIATPETTGQGQST